MICAFEQPAHALTDMTLMAEREFCAAFFVQIYEFFDGFDVIKVAFVLEPDSRPSGLVRDGLTISRPALPAHLSPLQRCDTCTTYASLQAFAEFSSKEQALKVRLCALGLPVFWQPAHRGGPGMHKDTA